ncbi:hypothetical protein SLS63_009935 [Diaporthe eres]|uniref:Heterokaryon incompatibility domain-containing protein n=1 Tax=Diaporthe eres TaxID=83184 RepID=A0ABR1NYE7_DIAER
MADLCSLCKTLFISDLVELAKPIFSNLLPHNSRHYPHYERFADLESSAEKGCKLCQLIVDGFKATAYPALGAGVTMHSALQLLPHDTTSVKLSIHSTHMRNAPQKVDDVQVFDTLMVHVGPGPDDRSVLDFDELHELPTRVLDVQAEGASEGCRIIQSMGRTGKYAALSHCWGGVITPVLCEGTIRDFLEDLPVSQLAANFQDTVKIVRELGLRYLWIDSLCILQDSALDWQVESANMAAVYQNAAVTIYASTSPGSKHGIFPREESTIKRPKPNKVNVPVFPHRDDKQFVQVQMLEEAEDEDLWKLDVMSPLAIRGWCLQELILSPRRLFCGKKQLYWQCLHDYQAADGLPRSPGVRTTTSEYQETMRQIHSTRKPSRQEVLSEYYTLVSRYSYRKLSYGSDKLLALTGLTSQLHAAVGGEYIAGLWTLPSEWLPLTTFRIMKLVRYALTTM